MSPNEIFDDGGTTTTALEAPSTPTLANTATLDGGQSVSAGVSGEPGPSDLPFVNMYENRNPLFKTQITGFGTGTSAPFQFGILNSNPFMDSYERNKMPGKVEGTSFLGKINDGLLDGTKDGFNLPTSQARSTISEAINNPSTALKYFAEVGGKRLADVGTTPLLKEGLLSTYRSQHPSQLENDPAKANSYFTGLAEGGANSGLATVNADDPKRIVSAADVWHDPTNYNVGSFVGRYVGDALMTPFKPILWAGGEIVKDFKESELKPLPNNPDVKDGFMPGMAQGFAQTSQRYLGQQPRYTDAQLQGGNLFTLGKAGGTALGHTAGVPLWGIYNLGKAMGPKEGG